MGDNVNNVNIKAFDAYFSFCLRYGV